MQFSDFTGEVQHRLELGTQSEAVRAARIVPRLYEGTFDELLDRHAGVLWLH